MKLLFATSNENKIKEASEILGIEVIGKEIDLPEIQAIDVKKIIEKKAREAYNEVKEPIIVEDTGLYIESLNGFPGALIKWMLKSIDNQGICDLIKHKDNKNAYAETCVGYFDGSQLQIFSGRINGKIASTVKGETGFGWDPIFIPENYDRSFAEMNDEEKNKISMRKIAFSKLKEFLEKNN